MTTTHPSRVQPSLSLRRCLHTFTQALSCLLLLTLLAGFSLASAQRTLTVVAPFEITSIDPSRAGYVFSRMGVSETLLEADEGGRPLPGLASTWQMSDEGTEWRFTVRDGVFFHDGTPLEAAHVVRSLEVAQAKPGILGQAPIEAIRAEGNEVIITLFEPFTPLLASLAHTSTQILAPASYNETGEVNQIIGTGAFQVEMLELPQRLVVTRFDAYWGDAPSIERASYLAAGRGETRALLAESGDAEIVYTLDPASMARLRRNNRLEVVSVAIPRTVTLKVNAGHPFLDDVRVREALSLAIDRQGIASAILRQPEAAANQLFPPSLAEWHLTDAPPSERNLERAHELLAELGWERAANGLLERDGETFRVTLRTFPDRPELPLIAAAIQDQFRELGIDLQVAIGNSSEIPAGHQDGTLELALLSRNFALIPDPLGTLVQDYSPNGGDWGAMNWTDSDMTAALTALRQGRDLQNSPALREAVARVLQEELPVIPVIWYQLTVAVANTVEGVTLDPFERTYGLSSVRWVD